MILSSRGRERADGGRRSIYISRRGRPHPISDQKGATRKAGGDEAAATDGLPSFPSSLGTPSHLKLNSKEASADPTIHLFLQLSRGDDDVQGF